MTRAALLVALVFVAGCTRHSVDARAVEQSSAQLAASIDFEQPDLDAIATAVEQLTNQVRRDAGLPPLATHRLLRRASSAYAAKMVRDGFLAHVDPHDGSEPGDRIAAAGGRNVHAAENLADVPSFDVGSGTPFYVRDAERYIISETVDGPPIPRHTYASFGAAVVEGWMNSPGHRRNLLSSDALEQGVGAAIYLQNGIPSFIVVQKFQHFEPLR